MFIPSKTSNGRTRRYICFLISKVDEILGADDNMDPYFTEGVFCFLLIVLIGEINLRNRKECKGPVPR